MTEETLAPETEEKVEEPEAVEGSAPESEEGSAESATAPDEQQELPKGWKWDGNVEALPEPFRERGKGMLRHLTEQSEKLAQQRKELEEQFQKLQQKPPEQPAKPQVDPTEVYLNREFQDAIETGDTGKMLKVQNELIDYRLQRQLKQLEPAYQSKLEELEKANKQVQNTMVLDEFGKRNPRLWVHRDSGLASMVVRELCDRQGKPLKDAYEFMEKISSFYQSEAKRSLNQEIQQKKQATSATPSAPLETEFVWVNSAEEADRKNLEFAAMNSPKIAKVKPK